MILTNYTTQVLIAEEGNYLTQAGEVDLLDRIITDKIYLAANDSASNWSEITKEVGDKIIAEQREELNKQIPENHE